MLTDLELQQTDLGDVRLNRRLRAIVDACTTHPTAPLPEACGASLDQTYRFFDNPRVTPDAIRQAHYADTRDRCTAVTGPVLLASDTTWLDFSTHPQTAGLGYQQNLTQHGLFLHSTLACTTAGLPVGLLDQQTWIRAPAAFGQRRTRRQRRTADKESGRWWAAAAACQTRLPPDTAAVFLADREGDVFDLFAAPRGPHLDLVVRADTRRRVVGEEALLGDVLAAAPVWGTLTVEVPRRDGQPGRTAVLQLRARRVALAVPRDHPDRRQLAPVEVTAVLAQEGEPPAGVTPVAWLLLSTLPLTDADTPARLVQYYTRRWRVEQYHFTLKSGCAVERLQLATRERLERAATVYTLVAVRLLRLTYLARHTPTAPATQEFAAVEVAVLQAQVAQQFRIAGDRTRPPTVQEAVGWIARLGGYAGRGRYAQPGVKVLWRGLRRLHDLVAGYELARGMIDTHAPPTVHSSVER
jgi:hypothetical protein